MQTAACGCDQAFYLCESREATVTFKAFGSKKMKIMRNGYEALGKPDDGRMP